MEYMLECLTVPCVEWVRVWNSVGCDPCINAFQYLQAYSSLHRSDRYFVPDQQVMLERDPSTVPSTKSDVLQSKSHAHRPGRGLFIKPCPISQ